MLVFELKLVESSRFKVIDDADVTDPHFKCSRCGASSKLHIADNDITIHINEFQLATMLRVLHARNRDLYEKLNGFYDKVSGAVEYTEG
jgi:hypothetical protein